jgi:hypothetical protein
MSSRARTIADFGDGIATADIGDGQITTAKIASDAITDALLPAGSVLQVVNNTTSTNAQTGGAFTNTGLSASITLSNSANTVLVMITQPMVFTVSTSAARESYVKLVRDSTDLATATQEWDIYIGSFTADNFVYSIIYEDNPGDTSSHTYKTEFAVSANFCDIYAQKGGNSQSQITLLEIQA